MLKSQGFLEIDTAAPPGRRTAWFTVYLPFFASLGMLIGNGILFCLESMGFANSLILLSFYHMLVPNPRQLDD
jgi:hypothetical protein